MSMNIKGQSLHNVDNPVSEITWHLNFLRFLVKSLNQLDSKVKQDIFIVK